MPSVKDHSYAVSLLFIFNGCLFGTWAAKVPFFKQLLSLNEQTISGLLLMLALGAVISFPLAGRVTDKLGVQTIAKITFAIYPLPFIALAVCESVTGLAISLFFFGFLHGAMDVAMNSWASLTERLSTKKLMPFFHAMFSLGAGAGAASSAAMVWLNIDTLMHFITICLLFGPFFILLFRPVIDVKGTPVKNEAKTLNSTQKLPILLLSLIGFIAFSSALGEGAIADWSAIMMRQEFDAKMSFVGWAYAVFSILMVISRLLGHFIIQHFGTVTVVRGCALFSLAGALLIITVNNVYYALLGFALLGIGYSVIVPMVFSKAAEISTEKSASAIALVATFAYGGMLLGPVLIGVIAQQTSLKTAFALLAVLPIYTLFAASLLKSKPSKLKHQHTVACG